MDKDIEELIYKKGRKAGIIIGAMISLVALSFAYIISEGWYYFR